MAEKRISEYPMPEQQVVVQVAPDQNIIFDIDLTQADMQVDGAQVVFTFPDKGQVVLDFTELGTAPLPQIVLADGTILNIQDFLASLTGSDIEPAAGPGTSASGGVGSSGVGEYREDAGNVIDGLTKADGLGPQAFGFTSTQNLRGQEDVADGAGSTAPESGPGTGDPGTPDMPELKPLHVSISDAEAVTEGGNLEYTVTLSGGISAEAITIPLTYGGTAAPVLDYDGHPMTVTIPAGSTTATVVVPTLTDNFVEEDETVTVTLGTPSVPDDVSSVTVIDSTGTGTILDGTVLPDLTVAISDSGRVTEGGNLEYTVTLSGGTSAEAITIPLTYGGTATPVLDYDGHPMTVTIPAGETTATIVVPTLTDNLVEEDETVVITLGTPSVPDDVSSLTVTDLTGTGTIVDGTPPPSLDLTVAISNSSAVMEGGDLVYTVTLTGGTSAEAITIPLTYGGTATPVLDYAGHPASVTIPAGETTATVVVPTLTDNILEGSETVLVNLGTPSVPGVTVTDPTGTGTILDGTIPPSPAPPPPAALTAKPDTNQVVEGAAETVSGNILTNDTYTAGTIITQIMHDGTTYTYDSLNPERSIPVTSNDGNDGSLKIHFETGQYTYTAPGSVTNIGGANFEDVFTYTLQDSYGNTASSDLTIFIQDTAPVAENDHHTFAAAPFGNIVSGNVIDGVPDTQGQDVQSQDTGLKVTGWYSGNEAQNLHFNSDLKIDGWQVLESGNQFRWLNDQGGYEYNHKKVSWDVLYDSGTKPIASTYPESSEDVWMWGDHFDNEYLLKDLDDLGASASFKEAQVTTDSASGLAVSSTRTGDSPDWIEFFWMDKDDNGGTISGEEVLILDLGEERSFMRLGLQERIEGANFQGKDDQFVLDLYNAKGKWIGTDDNSGNFYLVSDFDQDQEGSSKTINFKVGDASCSAQYVGIRAMPTETQWKDTNQAAPEGEGGDYTYSSAFAVTHISVSTSDQITYRVIDSDGSMDVATLTLTPQYTGEIP